MNLDYFRPDSLNSALNWLDENRACIAAGCTDLLPATMANRLTGPILDLTAIDELRGVAQDSQYWRFGATTTWTDLTRAELPSSFDAIKLAAREVGSIQIQHSGTLAGNICNASPAADGVPGWLTLDAEVELRSFNGTRQIALSSFIIGPRETALQENEIVSAILVPKKSAMGQSNFLKLGARKYLIISIAMIAARLMERDGLISDAAISVGSCNAVAIRLTGLEEWLIGKPYLQSTAAQIEDPAIVDALAPIDDIRSDASYRKIAACELVRRCVGGILSNKAVVV